MIKSQNRILVFAASVAQNLMRLRRDQRGNVAIMMGFALVPLVGAMGLGFEVSNWYMNKRSMQNAADAAAIAAATNAGANYDVEAKAVAARYGFVNGSNNTTVTVLNNVTCPTDGTNNCYSVQISRPVPLYLAEVVGFSGSTTLNGARAQTIISSAITYGKKIQAPVCLLAVGTSGNAITTNGAPKTDFTGCTVASDSQSNCNGSNLNAYIGVAAGTNTGCGNNQVSDSFTPDCYATGSNGCPNIPNLIKNNITNTCGSGASAYPQEGTFKGGGKKGSTPAWTQWSTNQSLGSGVTQICGDLQLTANVTINTTDASGAVLVVQNGQLDLNGYTLQTSNGSALTIVFSGTNTGSYTHWVTDSSTGSPGGILNIQGPTSGAWSGIALVQDPSLTSGVDYTYKGNNPTYDLTGLIYTPNANVTYSGAISKSTYGADCFVMISKTINVNGTGYIYPQSPDGSGCQAAGLKVPMATIATRGQLVY